MNELPPIAKSSQPRRKPLRPLGTDREFLAPDLEILETPPSPVRMRLLLVICAFVVAALAWAWVGRLDIVAVAEGKVEPSGKVKVIQPLQTGKVLSILVHNGDRVTAGQTLVELDSTAAQSQVSDLASQIDTLRGEIARRQWVSSSLAGDTPLPNASASVSWPRDVSPATAAREQGMLEGDLNALRAQLSSLDTQIEQKSTHVASLDATIAAQQKLNGALDTLAGMRQTLVDKDAGTKADWLNAFGQLQAQEVALTNDQAARADDLAAIAVLKGEQQKVRSAFFADNLQKLDAAQTQLASLAQHLRQAQSVLSDFTLKSPVDGIVEASSLTTIGQVVSIGEAIMRVVPVDRAVEVEAYITNEDIGFVHLQQRAEVKIAAFPYTRYGAIEGTVIAIGRDAISGADAARSIAGNETNPGPGDAAAGATQSLVFPIRVALDVPYIIADGKEESLTPGMHVSAEINTGSRRILDYLLSPMVEVTSTALHER